MPEKSDGITESRGFDGRVDTLLDTKGLNCPDAAAKGEAGAQSNGCGPDLRSHRH